MTFLKKGVLPQGNPLENGQYVLDSMALQFARGVDTIQGQVSSLFG